MELNIDEDVLIAFGYNYNTVKIAQIGSGLINRTYLITNQNQDKFILQNINTAVFKNPWAIANNIEAIASYLAKNYPDYTFIKPINTVNGKAMAVVNGEYWRLLPFIGDAVSFDVLTDPKQAYEAAKQFGKLSRLLNNFDTSLLEPSIPGFHDLNLRFEQFKASLEAPKLELKQMALKQIEEALNERYIVDYYNSFAKSKDFPNRVMHHDTKISNVLLNAETFEGICVIDLDTIMSGKFISDLGDMMRTYLCAFSENETDLSKVTIRLPYFEAMIKGYLSEMKNTLTATEKELILFSGKYIIYMQALRFLTDYLNGSIYYPIKYPEQNLDRAKNQFKLLQELSKNDKELQDIIEENLA